MHVKMKAKKLHKFSPFSSFKILQPASVKKLENSVLYKSQYLTFCLLVSNQIILKEVLSFLKL